MPSQRERRNATRTAILDAARETFVAADSIEVTLDEIAQAAGVAKSTVLYHFASRAGVLRAVAAVLYVGQLGRLRDAGPAGSMAWTIALVLDQGTDDGRLLFRIGDHLTVSGDLEEVDPRPVLTRIFVENGVEGDARLITAAVLELCRQRVHDYLDDATATELVRALFDGVRLRP